MLRKNFLFMGCLFLISQSFAQFVPTKSDSGWRALFNGEDLEGLNPHIEGYDYGELPSRGFIEVENGVITFYPGFTSGNNDPSNNGYLATANEYTYYRCRVEFRHGDYTNRANSGWLGGDPYNSGFFFHVKPGQAVWPPTIECQLKRHWNASAPNGGTTCTAADGDCTQVWAADYWILGGAQIRNRDGQLTALGGCCNPALVNRNQFPDYELEGWNWIEIEVYSDSAFSNILNGQRINWGTDATYQASNGQRVALTEGSIALELEGSEIQFRNWEILLFPEDPLYDSMYTPGCMDPGYEEYDENADLHMAEACENEVVPVQGIHPRASLFTWNARNKSIQFAHNLSHQYVFYTPEGESVLKGSHQGSGVLPLDGKLNPGIYFLEVNSGVLGTKKQVLVY